MENVDWGYTITYDSYLVHLPYDQQVGTELGGEQFPGQVNQNRKPLKSTAQGEDGLSMRIQEGTTVLSNRSKSNHSQGAWKGVGWLSLYSMSL